MAEGDGVDIVVKIPMGSSVADTGEILKENGLIRDDKIIHSAGDCSLIITKSLSPGHIRSIHP